MAKDDLGKHFGSAVVWPIFLYILDVLYDIPNVLHCSLDQVSGVVIVLETGIEKHTSMEERWQTHGQPKARQLVKTYSTGRLSSISIDARLVGLTYVASSSQVPQTLHQPGKSNGHASVPKWKGQI
jgi:hypothetical protein